jgi:putative salt-induced outer membrane protein
VRFLLRRFPRNLASQILRTIHGSGTTCRSFLHPLLPSLPVASCVLGAMLLPSGALADTVTLKNGDHLTGTVNQLVGGKLTVTTSYAGAVNISFDEVTSIKLDKPLVLPIETHKGKTVDIRKIEITAIDRTASGLVLTTSSGTEPAPKFDTLRTADAQLAYEASLRPNFLHGWTGAANVSLALARGNSETTSVGTGLNLARATKTDKTSLYFNTLYTHDGLTDSTTAQTTTAGARYDHNVNPKLFTFGTTDFATDALQYLDLRTVLGGGFGWHAIAKPNRQFDVLGGLVWTHESYSGQDAVVSTTGTITTAAVAPLTHSFAALDFGQQFTQKMGKTTSFTEQAYIFPDLADTSQFRSTVNAGLTTKINNFLSWQTSFSDVYVTNPPSGTKDNDVILTTGLGFTFNRK